MPEAEFLGLGRSLFWPDRHVQGAREPEDAATGMRNSSEQPPFPAAPEEPFKTCSSGLLLTGARSMPEVKAWLDMVAVWVVQEGSRCRRARRCRSCWLS